MDCHIGHQYYCRCGIYKTQHSYSDFRLVQEALTHLTQVHTSKFGTKRAGLNCNNVQFLTNLEYQMTIVICWTAWKRLRYTLCCSGRGSLTAKLWISWDYGCTTKWDRFGPQRATTNQQMCQRTFAQSILPHLYANSLPWHYPNRSRQAAIRFSNC